MKRSLCRILGAILAISICLPLVATQVVAEEPGGEAAAVLSPQELGSDPSELDSPEEVPDPEPMEPSEPDSPSEEEAVPAEDQEDAAQDADSESPFDIPLLAPMDRSRGRDSTDVYINGSTGSDANPGTKDAPVKTFAKAKELLEASGGDTIYVTGAITLSGVAETWDLDGKILKRDIDYHGELVRLTSSAALALENIVIDGNSENGATGRSTSSDGGGGSLAGVYGNSTLTIGEGAVLQNNSIESVGKWYPEGGGAVFANSSTVNVEGGTIRNNEAVWGGGIYGIYDSVINMSSGTITGNRALEGVNATLPADYGGCGGGICVYEGSDVNLSGGTISDNFAFERGGGISMGTYYGSTNNSSILTMTGGTITGNSAGSSGGGIFIQAGYSILGNNGIPTYSIAYITGGSITDNAMSGGGYGNKSFGGGGIYVNGYSSSYTSFHNGELYLTNVEVSGNSAVSQGGGYAACPVSETEINLTNGAVFYGNDAESARELYILASLAYGSHSGDPVYEISPSMLGGGAYTWTYDDGTEVPLDRLIGVLSGLHNQSLSLGNNLTADDAGVQKAVSLASVRITGNTSVTRGGGIGSNGSVFIGKSVETTEITVSKTWDDVNEVDGTRPTSIKVDLYRDGEYVGYQTMEPDAEGAWSMTFANLPKNDASGHEYIYTVEERVLEGYLAVVEGSADEGYTITNSLSTSVSVTKEWVGPVGGPVTVHLFADGVDTGKTIILSADNSWAGSFDDLRKYDAATGGEIVYTVYEDPVPHYSGEVSGNAIDGFIITNTNTNTETVDISGTKTWDDGNDRDGIRPRSITVNLLADGVEIAEKAVSAADGWSYSFTGLPKYDLSDGHEIAYTVTEDPVSGYTSTVKGYDITNTHRSAIPSMGDSSLTGLVLPALISVGLMAISISLRSVRRRPDLRG